MKNFDCHAAVIVVYASPDMRTSFNTNMNPHADNFPGHACTQSPVLIFAKDETVGGDVTEVFNFTTNAGEIRARFSWRAGRHSLRLARRRELSTCAAACMRRSRAARRS